MSSSGFIRFSRKQEPFLLSYSIYTVKRSSINYLNHAKIILRFCKKDLGFDYVCKYAFLFLHSSRSLWTLSFRYSLQMEMVYKSV